jgi:hypothetical protein
MTNRGRASTHISQHPTTIRVPTFDFFLKQLVHNMF